MNVFGINFNQAINESRKTIRIGLPLVAAQLVQMSMGFVDTIMAGNLGAKDLAAVAVGSSLIAPVLVFVIGLLLATNPIVAQLHGAQKKREIGKNVWQSLWLSQFLAMPALFMLRKMQFVMAALNIKPEIIPITQGYLDAFSWGFPAAFAYFSLRFFNEGIAVTKPSLYLALIGLLVNIVGNYVFMYGHLGFPAMGAVGTGWASALVWWIMFTGMAAFTFGNRKFDQFNINQGPILPVWSYLKNILKIGIPNGISVGVEVSMFALTALIIGSLGVDMVAGHQIAINFASLTFMIPLGLSIATTARVGFAAGKGDLQEARLIGYVGIALGAAVMSLAASILLVMPELVARLYTRDIAVTNIAVKLLFLAAVFQISDGVQVSVLGALRGLKDTKIPMFYNLIAYWIIGVPTGYVLGIQYRLGAEGLWIGLISGLTVAAILHNLRFYHLTLRAGLTEQISGNKSSGPERI